MNYEESDLRDKNILVTGGTTGIGRAIAHLLVSHGANVMIFGRNETHLKEAISDMQNLSGRIFGINADVSKKEDVAKVFALFDGQLGPIDTLVNNAALPSQSIIVADFDQIEYILKVNIMGYLYCAKKAISRMEKENNGHIVNIGSMSAEVKDRDSDLYVATKSAIRGFSASLRKKVNQYGIKVSLIEPGGVATNMLKEKSGERDRMQKNHKILDAKDIAEAVVFCLTRPKRCDIVSMQIRAREQHI